MLLDKDADITILNSKGENPLSKICYITKMDEAKKVINTLLRKGVDLNLKDADGDTLFSYTDCVEK